MSSHLDRVLVAGDAAGQAKPTTGGGLYCGLIGASAAAETVGQLSAGETSVLTFCGNMSGGGESGLDWICW